MLACYLPCVPRSLAQWYLNPALLPVSYTNNHKKHHKQPLDPWHGHLLMFPSQPQSHRQPPMPLPTSQQASPHSVTPNRLAVQQPTPPPRPISSPTKSPTNNPQVKSTIKSRNIKSACKKRPSLIKQTDRRGKQNPICHFATSSWLRLADQIPQSTPSDITAKHPPPSKSPHLLPHSCPFPTR